MASHQCYNKTTLNKLTLFEDPLYKWGFLSKIIIWSGFYKKIFNLFFRERGREGKRKGEKYRSAASCKPQTKVCTLTRNQTGDLLVHRVMPNPLNPSSQGWSDVFLKNQSDAYGEAGLQGKREWNQGDQLGQFRKRLQTPKPGNKAVGSQRMKLSFFIGNNNGTNWVFTARI